MISMNPMSWILARGAMEGFADGMVGKMVKGAWGSDVVQNAVKEKMPNWLGIGVTDEAKWAELLSGLTSDERTVITQVKQSLDKKHQNRWRLIITSLDIAGLCTRKVTAYTEYHPPQKGQQNPDTKVVKKQGKEIKDVPVIRNSKDDARIMHHKQVVKLTKNGNNVTDEAGIERAKVFLFTNFIEEVPFLEHFTAWFKAQAVSGWQKVSSAEAWLVWQLTRAAIGEDTFNGIVRSRVRLAEKFTLFEEALAEAVENKRRAVYARRGLPWSYWGMLIGVVAIIVVAALLISLGKYINP